MALSVSHTEAPIAAQRLPPGFEELLQSFEVWLLEEIQQRPGFLKQAQLALQYRSTLGPLLGSFQREADVQLTQRWQDSEIPLPLELLQELRRGSFWKQYICEWLLSQDPNANPLLDPVPVESGSNHGKWHKY